MSATAAHNPDSHLPSGDLTSVTDPMPPGRLAMWLFLISESMFFLGLFGSVFVLGGGAAHALFHKMAAVPGTRAAALAAACLVAASVALWTAAPGRRRLLLALALNAAFVGVQTFTWYRLLAHHTVIATINNVPTVVDGAVRPAGKDQFQVTGRSFPLPNHFEVSRLTPDELTAFSKSSGTYTVQSDAVYQDLSFGPWRNNYFGCYFLITAVHVLHLLVGMIAVGWLVARRPARNNPRVVGPVLLYWHYVNLVGLVGLSLLLFV